MSSYLELKQQAENLLKQAEELRKQKIVAIIADMKKQIAEYGITAKDLGLSTSAVVKKNAGKSKLEARYKGPNGELWSGMGRQPQWLKDAIQQGKTKEDFAL